MNHNDTKNRDRKHQANVADLTIYHPSPIHLFPLPTNCKRATAEGQCFIYCLWFILYSPFDLLILRFNFRDVPYFIRKLSSSTVRHSYVSGYQNFVANRLKTRFSELRVIEVTSHN